MNYHKQLVVILSIAAFISISAPVFSEYKIILKNGSEFIVDSYKEIDGRIKFLKIGGEIEIDKTNIEKIVETKVKTKEHIPVIQKPEETITEKPISGEAENVTQKSAAAESRLREIAKRKDELKVVAEKLNEEKKKLEEEINAKGRMIGVRQKREFERRIVDVVEKINKFNEELNSLNQEQESILKKDF